MTRDDISVLLEKAAGLCLIVIGIDQLPELMSRWIHTFGMRFAIRDATLDAALRTAVQLIAGAFLLLRKQAPAAMPPATQPPQSAMSRADWLWVGCKLLGAYFALYGGASVIYAVKFGVAFDHDWLEFLFSFIAPTVWIIGGAFLFFGNGLWRLACRETPANR